MKIISMSIFLVLLNSTIQIPNKYLQSMESLIKDLTEQEDSNNKYTIEKVTK